MELKMSARFWTKETSNLLFSNNQQQFQNEHVNQHHINNLVKTYGGSMRADARAHLRELLNSIIAFHNIIDTINNILFGLCDRIMQMFVNEIINVAKNNLSIKKKLIIQDLLFKLSTIDLVYALFYVYAMIVIQFIYKQKSYKLITGTNTNSFATSNFPKCDANIMRFFMVPDNIEHTKRGIVFLTTMMHELGDFNTIRSFYVWWFQHLKQKDFFEIPLTNVNAIRGAGMKFALRTTFSGMVSTRFLPFIKNNTLYIPNLLNESVTSTRYESNRSTLDSYLHVLKWLLATFSPAFSKGSNLIHHLRSGIVNSTSNAQSMWRDVVEDFFGANHKNLSGKIHLQIVIVYIKILSSMLLLQETDLNQQGMFSMMRAQCHFFHHFQSKSSSEAQWNAIKPMMFLIKRCASRAFSKKEIIKLDDLELNMFSQASDYFMHDIVKNNDKSITRLKNNNDNVRTKQRLDKIVQFFDDTDPTFRYALVLYANFINWLVLVMNGSTSMNSGFLEFKQGVRSNTSSIYFEHYININNPNDDRVRALKYWIVTKRIDVPNAMRSKYRNWCIHVLFHELWKKADIKRMVVDKALAFAMGSPVKKALQLAGGATRFVGKQLISRLK